MPEVQVETSKKFTLNWRDAVRGVVIAAIGSMVTQIYTMLQAGDVVFNWKAILTGGLTAGIAYIVRNFFEPSKTLIKVTPPLKGMDGENGGSGSGTEQPSKPPGTP